ncbi:TetR/AcrR family transcriptional regulator [Sulfitobacter sp. HNIBRBA3233]|uniref:TetR/AcrR family transcriptional regulator n=1 Tax=Sulfitobacter marinivivus TaxID=3158558 RepID=UPI0032DFEBCE
MGAAEKRPREDGVEDSRYAAILNAAEIVFANEGFKGASLREIARRAEVAQALIHYHFETKEKLFEAMAARQAVAINDARGRMLDKVLAFADPQLEPLVEALFRPTIEKGQDIAMQGGGFSRILVSIANSTDPRDRAYTERYYDPIARRFIAALERIEPQLGRKDAVWAYMFSIGVGMMMMAQTGRSTRLSDGQCDDSQIEDMLAEIITYVCGGIRALAHKED